MDTALLGSFILNTVFLYGDDHFKSVLVTHTWMRGGLGCSEPDAVRLVFVGFCFYGNVALVCQMMRTHVLDNAIGGRLQRSRLGGAIAGGRAGRPATAQEPRADRRQGRLHRKG